MAGRQHRAAGIGWITVHQARQLLDHRQPPPLRLPTFKVLQ
jgi:hypothetical protein